jgi:hypothetical protein
MSAEILVTNNSPKDMRATVSLELAGLALKVEVELPPLATLPVTFDGFSIPSARLWYVRAGVGGGLLARTNARDSTGTRGSSGSRTSTPPPLRCRPPPCQSPTPSN